jgi:hypothetical protein
VSIRLKASAPFGAVAFTATLLSSANACAHHSHANIDRSNIQQHTGVVTEYGWSMPHVYLKVQAPNASGAVVEYSIELLHPPGMLERGWNRDSFVPGETITWQGASDVDPDRYYSGLDWVEKADGTRLSAASVSFDVAPSTDFTGLWKRDLRGGRPHYFPPEDWPYSERGQALVDRFAESQNPMIECIDPGPPKYLLLPYPIEISRPDETTIVMAGELRQHPRVVHLDRDHPKGPASALGHSVGWFEGDELVVETANFIADRWGTHTGVDSSEHKHLLERFRLSNGGLSIDVEITVTDPIYLSAPVTFDYHLTKLPDRELVQVPCTRDSARLFLEGGYQDAGR